MMGQRVNKTWSKKRVAQREKKGDLPGKNWENLGWNLLFNQQWRDDLLKHGKNGIGAARDGDFDMEHEEVGFDGCQHQWKFGW